MNNDSENSANAAALAIDGPAAQGSGGRASDIPPAALHGRLLQVSQMATIGEMAAGVAHELNQPLTAITNYAHACRRLLERPDPEPAELREALKEIAAQAARAADIIRRLRALARDRHSERALLSVNALIGEMIQLVEGDARNHHVRLSLELAEALPAVLVNGGQIQQAILNFARNSLEALSAQAPSGGTLMLRTSLTGANEVEVAVIDNGPGPTREALHRLFDPFFSTKVHGTGLGLAMNNTIAREHGGSVGYRPHLPHGACFYLLLPAVTG